MASSFKNAGLDVGVLDSSAGDIYTASGSGVTAVIQPGGSIRDKEVIAAADERNIAMIFTSVRHFRH